MLIKAKIFGKDIGIISHKNGGFFFEYFETFLKDHIEISPFYLPLSPRVYSGKEFLAFEMIPSVFADSLPDSFGSMLMASYFKHQGGNIHAIKNPLNKLSYIGDRGIGAIEYEPIISTDSNTKLIEFHTYIKEVRKIVEGSTKEVSKEITAQASPGGARPKAFVNWDRGNDRMLIGKEKAGYEPWIVKFYEDEPSKQALTKTEYVYFQIAKEVGVDLPEFDYILEDGEFHFAVKRFDRANGKKLHLHTLAGLMNKRFDERGLFSYEELLKVTMRLTHNMQNVKEAYRRTVFNIIGQNCDDHAKNFSFLMNEKGEWSLAPAYDLLYSYAEGIYKEHFLSLGGKLSGFNKDDLLALALEYDISKGEAMNILEETLESFNRLPKYAREIGLEHGEINFLKL